MVFNNLLRPLPYLFYSYIKKKLLYYITMPTIYAKRLLKEGFLEENSKRIGAYLNNKYATDDEFREKKKEYQRQYRLRKKNEKNN